MYTTVVIPCFRIDDHLDEAIRSVEKQISPVKQLIVIDDGSPVPLTQRTNWRAPGELIWIRTENRGLGAARNLGILRATGSYIAFLDADDFWDPAKIQKQEQLLTEHPQAVACYTQCVDAEGFFPFGPYPDSRLGKDQLAGLVWYGQFFPPSSLMVRASVAKQCGGFREGLVNGEDLDFLFRLIEIGEIYGVSERLTWYRKHPQQITSDPIRRVLGAKESRRGIIERFPDRLKLAGISEKRFWDGYRHEVLCSYYRKDISAARVLLLDYWRDHPWDSRILKYLLVSYFLPWAVR